MGIYTNMTVPAQHTYNTCNEHVNIMESCLEIVAECEAARLEFDRELALEELYAIEQTGNTDILYEGVSIKSILEKIKDFFKKIIEKVKNAFKKLWSFVSGKFGSNKQFFDKYGDKFIKKWKELPDDWTYYSYVYSYSPIGPVGDEISQNMYNDIKSDIEEHLQWVFEPNNKSSMSELDNIDIDRHVLELVYNNISDDSYNKIKNDSYSEKLFKFYRNYSGEKEDVTKKTFEQCLNGLAKYVTETSKNIKEVEKSLNSYYNCVTKAFTESIKMIEQRINNIKEDTENKEDIVKYLVKYKDYITELNAKMLELAAADVKAMLEFNTVIKQIAVKVLGLNPNKAKDKDNKSTNESYDYGNDRLNKVQFI